MGNQLLGVARLFESDADSEERRCSDAQMDIVLALSHSLRVRTCAACCRDLLDRTPVQQVCPASCAGSRTVSCAICAAGFSAISVERRMSITTVTQLNLI